MTLPVLQGSAEATAKVDMRATSAFLANPALVSHYLTSCDGGAAAATRDRCMTQLLRWLLDSMGRPYRAGASDPDETLSGPEVATLKNDREGDTRGLEEGLWSRDAEGLADATEPWKPYLTRCDLVIINQQQ